MICVLYLNSTIKVSCTLLNVGSKKLTHITLNITDEMVHWLPRHRNKKQPTDCIASYKSCEPNRPCCLEEPCKDEQCASTDLLLRADHQRFVQSSLHFRWLGKVQKEATQDEGKSLPDTSSMLGHQTNKDSSDRIGYDRNERMWRPVVEK